MTSQAPLPSLDERIVVEPRGPGEWIVDGPVGGRSLHVYRLAAADWLVSEVGRGNEGRASGLREALAMLSAGVSSPEWWDLVAEALFPAAQPGRGARRGAAHNRPAWKRQRPERHRRRRAVTYRVTLMCVKHGRLRRFVDRCSIEQVNYRPSGMTTE